MLIQKGKTMFERGHLDKKLRREVISILASAVPKIPAVTKDLILSM